MKNELDRSRILVIDDDAQLRAMLCELLRSEGLQADQSENGRQGLSKMSEEDYQLVVVPPVYSSGLI